MVEAICEVLDDYVHEYKIKEISEYVERWYKKKYKLMELLSKHPNWDDSQKAVVIPRDFVREIDCDTLREQIEILTGNSYKIRNLIQYSMNNFVDESFFNYVKYYDLAKIEEIHLGQKMSRALNKVFKHTGLANSPDYNKIFAKISDCVNPHIANRRTVISVHPIDYLLMSNGDNWTSCQRLDDGCHKAGTLSYMGDEVTMIVYTVSDKYDGKELCLAEKIERNIFCYHEGYILQSRLYPTNSSPNRKTFRNIVQEVIAQCLGISNKWIINDRFKYFITKSESLHYEDYLEEYVTSCKPKLWDEYLAQGHTHSGFDGVIGSDSYCLVCGDHITDANSLLCWGCRG
jgi:hypothetical protein